MDYYNNNLSYILEYERKKSFKKTNIIIVIIFIIALIISITQIKIYSYKEYYALKVEEGEKEILVSNVIVEDTNDILNSEIIEIDNKKYPIQEIKLISNTDNFQINYNSISIESENISNINANTLIKVKFLYSKETILNKVKKILL